MSEVHNYFAPPGSNTVDAKKIEADAQRWLTDRNHPRESLIHYHRHGESCDGKDHREINFPGRK